MDIHVPKLIDYYIPCSSVLVSIKKEKVLLQRPYRIKRHRGILYTMLGKSEKVETTYSAQKLILSAYGAIHLVKFPGSSQLGNSQLVQLSTNPQKPHSIGRARAQACFGGQIKSPPRFTIVQHHIAILVYSCPKDSPWMVLIPLGVISPPPQKANPQGCPGNLQTTLPPPRTSGDGNPYYPSCAPNPRPKPREFMGNSGTSYHPVRSPQSVYCTLPKYNE